MKKDLEKTINNNKIVLEKDEDVLLIINEVSKIDETLDNITDTEVATILKDKIVEKIQLSSTKTLPVEVSEIENKKSIKAVESIINTNKTFNFYNNLRAETYINSLEDETLKKELNTIYDSIKEENKEIVLETKERLDTPPILIDAKEANFKIENSNGIVEEVKPFIKNGRTLSSVRVIAETLNADVEWNGATRSILLTKDGIEVTMQIDNDIMYVNGEPVKMDIKPIIKNSRSYFPARFIAESLGSTVLWNAEYNTVFID